MNWASQCKSPREQTSPVSGPSVGQSTTQGPVRDHHIHNALASHSTSAQNHLLPTHHKHVNSHFHQALIAPTQATPTGLQTVATGGGRVEAAEPGRGARTLMSLCVRAGPPTPKDEAHNRGANVVCVPACTALGLAAWSALPRNPVLGQTGAPRDTNVLVDSRHRSGTGRLKSCHPVPLT
jgi:hypothetical protein